MNSTGKFDRDSVALKNRISAHDRFGQSNINEWIFSNLELGAGLKILDLGCGTGKQSIPMAELVGDSGKVTSVDISRESLDALEQQARIQKISSRINQVCCNLDMLKECLDNTSYDRVLGSFSLYYSKNTELLFSVIYELLKPGGILFFCGPSMENNHELKQFHSLATKKNDLPTSEGALFMEKASQRIIKEIFDGLDVFRFENMLRFDSYEALYNYWSSYNLYDPQFEVQFKKLAKIHFEKHSFFETTKRVIGIKAVKKLTR